MFYKKISPTIVVSTIILSLVLALGINLVFAWTDPSANPPLNNVSAPINVGSTAQIKTGNLTVPIVYDYNNTGYYANPAGNSWFNRIYTYDIRADIMYDRNNTAYYVNPNGTTNLYTLCIRGDCRTGWPSEASLNGWSFGNNYFYDDGEEVIRASDEWLRLNQDGDFTSGVYTPGLIRADGGFQIDGTTAINSNNRYHYSYYSGGYSKFGSVNTSGFGIDARNNGDWDFLAYEGNVYLQYSNPSGRVYIGGSIYDYNDSVVNIGESAAISGNLQVTGLVNCDTIDTNASGQLVCGTDSGGIAVESDTLDTVSDRGNSTNQALTFPIMYDYNSTGYYANPAGNSWLYRIYSYDVRADIMYDRNNTGYYVNPNSNSWLYRIYSYDIRADIMYDRNNTGYYVDPNGTTNLYTLCIRGNCETGWPSGGDDDWSIGGNSISSDRDVEINGYLYSNDGATIQGGALIVESYLYANRYLSVDGNARIRDNLRVDGDLTADNNDHGSCYTTNVSLGWKTCRNGYYMVGIRISDGEVLFDRTVVEMECCKL